MNLEFLNIILEKDVRYPKEAYEFVLSALNVAGQKYAEVLMERESPHVTGQELLEAIREFALEEYGPMAIDLFNEWGIKYGIDFGNIVFNLVNNGFLAKTEQDSINDFQKCYTFHDAFVKPFQPVKRTITKQILN